MTDCQQREQEKGVDEWILLELLDVAALKGLLGAVEKPFAKDRCSNALA